MINPDILKPSTASLIYQWSKGLIQVILKTERFSFLKLIFCFHVEQYIILSQYAVVVLKFFK